MSIKALLVVVLTGWLSPASAAERTIFLASHPLDAEHMLQWRLPGRLTEISGLATTSDGRLLAVADEKARIFELDIVARRVDKEFQLGDPVVRGDFEGIAVVDDKVYLITSDGDIYIAEEGEDGEQVDYAIVPTGLGEQCEIEGLAALPEQRRLLIVCKQARGGIQRLPIFAWALDQGTVLDDATVDLPVAGITRAIRDRRVNPSGIAVDPGSGNLIIVAARQRAIMELTPEGDLVRALPLPMLRRHRQPEGIEILSDGRLLIADEGGNHKARLAVYAPADESGVASE